MERLTQPFLTWQESPKSGIKISICFENEMILKVFEWPKFIIIIIIIIIITVKFPYPVFSV
jgi:hypothetical protein